MAQRRTDRIRRICFVLGLALTAGSFLTLAATFLGPVSPLVGFWAFVCAFIVGPTLVWVGFHRPGGPWEDPPESPMAIFIRGGRS